MKKILIIALSGIGDALMFSPALKTLRENSPDDEIDLLCMIKGVEDIYKYNSDINKIIFFDFLKNGALNSLKFVLEIRNSYDVSFSVYPANRREYNIISFLINAKERYAIGYLRQNFANFGFLNNRTITENDFYHNVEENLSLVAKYLKKDSLVKHKMKIHFSQNELDYKNSFLRENKILEKDIIVGIHAGCALLKNHIKRRWEPEKFAELSKKLIEKYNARILLFGGPDEYELNDYINSLAENKLLIVKTNSLLQSASIMTRCNKFITNDSALMHVASALGLNVLALFGPTNTNYVHPWMTNHKIAKLELDCQPCFYYSPKPLTCSRSDLQFKCIKELTPEYVLNLFDF